MAVNVKKTIRESGEVLRELFEKSLAAIGDEMISQIMSRAKRLAPSEKLRALKEIAWTGELEYQRNVIDSLAEIALEAITDARKEVPSAKNVRLSEALDSMQLAQATSLEKLPKGLRDRILKNAQLLVGTQLADLQKTLFFQYTDSVDTTEDDSVLEDDLKQAAVEYITGSAVTSGSKLLSSKTVNEARNAFFFDDEVLQQIDAFEFVNGDPVTPVCQDLNGTVFAKDDPELFRYTPPLHWNCKSFIRPVLAGNLKSALSRAGQKKIQKLRPSTKKIEDTIQFSECNH